jgi:hypothetical protein
VYTHFSNGCLLCIIAGYTESIDVSPPQDALFWWQTREDGSRHNRRSDEDYLELLEFSLDGKVDKTSRDMGRNVWNGRLYSMAADWKKSPKKNECEVSVSRIYREFTDNSQAYFVKLGYTAG